jgi:NAD(P)-dependent dehydrogenase (short-subunit alcohol dehydrogenase family)
MSTNNNRKIILISGCNKGIGYTLVENLIKQKLNMNIIFTSRNENLGNASLNKIISKYPDYKSFLFYHQLDITDKQSINAITDWIKTKFKKIDILFNNAGIYNNPRDQVINTNVFGTFNLTQTFLENDIINNKGKIISVGSGLGSFSCVGVHQNEFKNAKTVNDLTNLANRYLSENWSGSAYSVSKLLIHLFAKVLGNDKIIIKKNISVYAMDPGWCKTDMGGYGAPHPPEHGADIGIFLIKLPDGINQNLQGKYFNSPSPSPASF